MPQVSRGIESALSLESPELLVGVRLVQMRGLLEYAEEQVTAIIETKRPRAVKEEK